MSEIKILFIGADKKIAAIVLRLINSNPMWKGFVATSIEETRSIFTKENFDLLLMGAGFLSAEENEIINFCKNVKPEIICIDHFGGGSGLLFNEIQFALDKKK